MRRKAGGDKWTDHRCCLAAYDGWADALEVGADCPGDDPELYAAACYAGEHALMWKLWDLAGGNGNPDAYRYFADPAVRRQMVPIIQQARDKDAQAADHLEQALRQAKGAIT